MLGICFHFDLFSLFGWKTTHNLMLYHFFRVLLFVSFSLTRFSRFIVYDVAQVKVRYLVQMKFKYAY